MVFWGLPYPVLYFLLPSYVQVPFQEFALLQPSKTLLVSCAISLYTQALYKL